MYIDRGLKRSFEKREYWEIYNPKQHHASPQLTVKYTEFNPTTWTCLGPVAQPV
jgi:hypothetical protein